MSRIVITDNNEKFFIGIGNHSLHSEKQLFSR